MFRKFPLALAGATFLVLTAPAFAADSMTQEVKALNDGWAHIAYEVKGSSTQTRALDRLAQQAAMLVKKYPGRAEPLIWQGIVTSEQANRANIFHKLGLATRARDILTKAYSINPKAEDGGAAMTLGVLYYKVPGSPIGFGDDQKAKKLLKEALAVDPNGLDANYFYGDFLYDQGDKVGAKSYLQKALRAPHDPSRPAWDSGRRREVQALLAKIG
ncbi:MAG TPA: tetratricopeptide repeat protein [Croceibacterium sp.]|nr:tetratricopeptide repeat protein [Croceibacterium sp.]